MLEEEYTRGDQQLENYYRDNYNTVIPPELWDTYQQFRQSRLSQGIDDERDYDLRGWWMEQEKKPTVWTKGGSHLTDTYKKPNHKTFSVYSKYNGVDGRYGGYWYWDPYNPQDGYASFYKPHGLDLSSLYQKLLYTRDWPGPSLSNFRRWDKEEL